MKTYYNYIDGKWVGSEKNKTIPSINPAKISEVVGYLQDSNVDRKSVV